MKMLIWTLSDASVFALIGFEWFDDLNFNTYLFSPVELFVEAHKI